MSKKPLITPRGKASYPHLHKADVYTDQTGKKSPPTFKVDLVVDADMTEELVAQLEEMLQAEVDKQEKEGNYNEVFINEDELPFYNEDGETTFKFRLKEEGKNNATGETWKNAPLVYDSRGKRIDKVPKIGAGSVLKVSFDPYTWAMPTVEGRGKSKVTNLKVGISLRLKAVMLVKLEKFSGASASDMGFGVEEDGYEYDPNEFDEEVVEGTSNGADASGEEEDF